MLFMEHPYGVAFRGAHFDASRGGLGDTFREGLDDALLGLDFRVALHSGPLWVCLWL